MTQPGGVVRRGQSIDPHRRGVMTDGGGRKPPFEAASPGFVMRKRRTLMRLLIYCHIAKALHGCGETRLAALLIRHVIESAAREACHQFFRGHLSLCLRHLHREGALTLQQRQLASRIYRHTSSLVHGRQYRLWKIKHALRRGPEILRLIQAARVEPIQPVQTTTTVILGFQAAPILEDAA